MLWCGVCGVYDVVCFALMCGVVVVVVTVLACMIVLVCGVHVYDV